MNDEPPTKINVETPNLLESGFVFVLVLLPLAFGAFLLAPIPTIIAFFFLMTGLIEEAKREGWFKAGEVFEIAKNRAISRTVEIYPEMLSGYRKAKIREIDSIRQLIEDYGGDPDDSAFSDANNAAFKRIKADGGDTSFWTEFFSSRIGREVRGDDYDLIDDIKIQCPPCPYKQGFKNGQDVVSYKTVAGIVFGVGIAIQGLLYYLFDIKLSISGI